MTKEEAKRAHGPTWLLVAILIGVFAVPACNDVHARVAELQQASAVAETEGAQFGRAPHGSEEACVTEAFGRGARCADPRKSDAAVQCVGIARLFLEACLASSARSPHFCDGAPKTMSIDVAWQRKFFEAHGSPKNGGYVYVPVRAHCAR